jgi:hypothetical protein
MTTIQIATNFDQPRPMSQQDYHHSPADSPLVHRPASQASHHLAPVATGHYSPALHSETHHAPLTSFPGQFRPFTPSLTLPHTASYANGNSNAYPPPTAPPLSYFPTTSAPIYDARHGQTMMRTTSHAHPMYSEHTASTRYSPDPNSAGGLHHASPPSATLPLRTSTRTRVEIISTHPCSTTTTMAVIIRCLDRLLALPPLMPATIWVDSLLRIIPTKPSFKVKVESTCPQLTRSERYPIQCRPWDRVGTDSTLLLMLPDLASDLILNHPSCSSEGIHMVTIMPCRRQGGMSSRMSV